MQAKIWNFSEWIAETKPETIKQMFDELLTKAGFNIIGFRAHYFQPQGYTGLWLLSESHFAVHTFPEFGKTYIELSSCNLEYYQKFLTMTKEI